MKRYNINTLTNDVCEVLLVYEETEFFKMMEFVETECNNFLGSDNYLKTKSVQEFIETNIIHYQIILKILSIDVQSICNFKFNSTFGSKIKVEDVNDDGEVYVYITYSKLDDEFKIKYPKYEDISLNVEKYSDEDIKNRIRTILITNGFINKTEVSKSVIGECDIYLKINDTDCLLDDVLDEEQTLMFYFNKGIGSEVKINDKVKVKNKALGHGNIIYTISKIDKVEAMELTDDIVKKLRYQKCKTVDEFYDTFVKDSNLVKTFNEIVYNIKDEITSTNEEMNSYECINLYKDYISLFLNKNYDDNEIRKFLKNERIELYLNIELHNMNIDTFLVENIIKTDYALSKLYDQDIADYNEFFEEHLNDLKLYLYVKNNK